MKSEVHTEAWWEIIQFSLPRSYGVKCIHSSRVKHVLDETSIKTWYFSQVSVSSEWKCVNIRIVVTENRHLVANWPLFISTFIKTIWTLILSLFCSLFF